MTRRTYLSYMAFSLLWGRFGFGAEQPKTSLTCHLCGMFIKEGSHTGYVTELAGKPIHLCSFACAQKFHKEHPNVSLFGHDFNSGEKVNAESAYFIVKSSKLIKDAFGMPPAVVVFKSKEEATKFQAHLGEGEVVKSFSEAIKRFE